MASRSRRHGVHHHGKKCHNGDGIRTVLATKDNIRTLIELIKEKFDEVIASITHLSFEVVTTLPDVGKPNIIYLVPNDLEGMDRYDEYYWDAEQSRFEILGSSTQYVIESDEVITFEYESSIKPLLTKKVTIKTGDKQWV